MSKNSDKKRRQKENKRLRLEEDRQREQQQQQQKAVTAQQDAAPSDPSSSSEEPLESAASCVESAIKPPTNAPFAARKRQLTPVSFVYPSADDKQKVQQTAEPYAFGSFQLEQASSATVTAENESTSDSSSSLVDENDKRNNKKQESIDDILFGPAKRPRANSSSSANAESSKQSAPSLNITASMPDQHAESQQQQPSSPRQSTPRHGHLLSGQTVDDAVRDKQGLRPRANSTDGELQLPQRGLCDEREVLEAHQWKRSSVFSRGAPKGLLNLGNTCFLNSTLQCLAFLPPFCQSLIALPDDLESMSQQNGNNSPRGHHPSSNGKKKISQGKRVTLLLRALFRRMHDTDHQGAAIAPRGVVQAVPLLGSIGSSRNSGSYKFRPGRQEDAHEFLVHLLDAMNDGELRQAGINQNISGWRDRLPVARLDETTLLRRVFGGYFRNEVKCTQCGKKSKTYDPFLDLSLEVSQRNCNSLAHAIREFTRKETLDSDNRWKCPGCKKKVCAVKQLTVFRPPLALCIQLKRFSFSGGTSFGGGFGFKPRFGGGMKITKPVEFSAQLDLPLSDGRSCGYALTGVVIHVGGSASSGHYTAYVKRPDESGAGKWFHMDDSFVQAVSESAVLRQRDAYVLFYCRREVRLEFPSPPLRGSMTAEEATILGRARAKARAESIDNSAPDLGSSSSTASTVERQEVEAKVPMIGPVAKPQPVPFTKGTPELPKVDVARVYPVPLDKDSSDDESSDSDASPSGRDIGRATCSEKPAAMMLKQASTQPSNFSKLLQLKSKEAIVTLAPDRRHEAPNESNEKPKPQNLPSSATKTRIVVDRGAGRERIEVLMGPRHKSKAWKPSTTGFAGKDEAYGLLGNQRVIAWDDEETAGASTPAKRNQQERQQLVSSMEKAENKRKRGQFQDRWDAALDTGKHKKVKARKDPLTPTDPKNNVFQKIQSDVLKMFGKRKTPHSSSKKQNLYKKDRR